MRLRPNIDPTAWPIKLPADGQVRPEMDPEAKNTEHFTSISSLILFVFTCKGVHMMA